MTSNRSITPLFLLSLLSLFSTQAGAINSSDATEIVAQCERTHHGQDNTTLFTIQVVNRHGQERTSIYKRYWKYYGNAGVQDKMVLFTLAPADAKNTAFMKVSYNRAKDKEDDQWLYMPKIRRLKAISRRDKNESFLGSDLTYSDIADRAVNDDVHKLLNKKMLGRDVSYLIESRPKETDSIYHRKVVEYYYSDAKQACFKKNIHYYDLNNQLTKTQDFTWQQIDGVWLWDKVTVRNVQTLSTSIFSINRPQVNTGLSDRVFSKRLLKRGI